MSCSLHKVVAMVLVYRRIVRVIALGSLIVGCVPSAFWLARSLLSLVTDHSAIALVLTASLTAAACRFVIPALMPTTPKGTLDFHLHKKIYKIIVFWFLVSCHISKYLGPLLPSTSPVPSLSFLGALKTSALLTVASLFAGLFVAARYFAGLSISKYRRQSGSFSGLTNVLFVKRVELTIFWMQRLCSALFFVPTSVKSFGRAVPTSSQLATVASVTRSFQQHPSTYKPRQTLQAPNRFILCHALRVCCSDECGHLCFAHFDCVVAHRGNCGSPEWLDPDYVLRVFLCDDNFIFEPCIRLFIT